MLYRRGQRVGLAPMRVDGVFANPANPAMQVEQRKVFDFVTLGINSPTLG